MLKKNYISSCIVSSQVTVWKKKCNSSKKACVASDSQHITFACYWRGGHLLLQVSQCAEAIYIFAKRRSTT
jgi:hypothetical protein